MDKISKEHRSWNMSRIRGRDTKPELIVRSLLHKMGFRFRLHRKDLPGKPDIVLPKYRAVIFVNGCFWHGHDCHLFRWPKTNTDFWRNKILKNISNDSKNTDQLLSLGWRVFKIWECSIKNYPQSIDAIILKLSEWIGSDEIIGECSADQLKH